MSKESVSSLAGKGRGASSDQCGGMTSAKVAKAAALTTSQDRQRKAKVQAKAKAKARVKSKAKSRVGDKTHSEKKTKSRGSNLSSMNIFGVNLGGGKAGRTWVAQLDYFLKHDKIFLRKIHENVDGGKDGAADASLLKILNGARPRKDLVAMNVPLQLPKCLRCRLSCPGYEKCKLPEIQWLRKNHLQYRAKKRPKKLFTPYTQRCVEQYVATSLEEPFFPPHALGSNLAPLTARAQYLIKHIPAQVIEVMPSVSVWRLGQELRVARSQLRIYHHSTEGEAARHLLLQRLVARNLVFVYEQDVQILEQNVYAFDAFVTALTAYFYQQKKCEDRPKGFPKSASWIAIPRKNMDE